VTAGKVNVFKKKRIVGRHSSHANAVPVAMSTSQVSTGAAPGVALKNGEPI
jgi:hypothetical protein